jgi:hypothetical protein
MQDLGCFTSPKIVIFLTMFQLQPKHVERRISNNNDLYSIDKRVFLAVNKH